MDRNPRAKFPKNVRIMKVCLLHGRAKPKICAETSANVLHYEDPLGFFKSCRKCGNCCQAGVKVSKKEIERIEQALLKEGEPTIRGQIMADLGGDPDRVVAHLKEHGRVPRRWELGFPDPNPWIRKEHCSFLVPEENTAELSALSAIKRRLKKGKR